MTWRFVVVDLFKLCQHKASLANERLVLLLVWDVLLLVWDVLLLVWDVLLLVSDVLLLVWG